MALSLTICIVTNGVSANSRISGLSAILFEYSWALECREYLNILNVCIIIDG